MFISTWTSSFVYQRNRAITQKTNTPSLKGLSCLLFLPVFLCGCSAASSRGVAQQQQTATSEPAANDSESTGFFNGAPKEEQEAWRLFIKNGEYRAAQPQDFRLPEKARQTRKNDLEKSIEHPYVGGDINHDGAYNDFAVIVVNTKRNDPSRFGLVVFNQPAGRSGSYESYWIFRDRDLSTTILEWWSGGLALREYRDDGSSNLCYINWQPEMKLYYCGNTPDR